MPAPRPLPPFPTFVIIGAQRCATRWLKVNLNKHPDIYAPPYEIDFWNDAERRATWKMAGYRRKFDGWEGEPITGEASPSYMFYDKYAFEIGDRAKAMWRQIPDVRLVAIVRDPVERIESAIRHYVKHRRLPRDFDIATHSNDPAYADLRLIQASQYASSLQPWLQRFGDQLKIFFLEDIRDDPAGAYRDVLRHVGASDDFVPPGIDRVMFSSASTVSVRPLTPEQRWTLRGILRPSVEELEAITGRDLSAWRDLTR